MSVKKPEIITNIFKELGLKQSKDLLTLANRFCDELFKKDAEIKRLEQHIENLEYVLTNGKY